MSKSIYKRAIEKYGFEAQLRVAQEELAELIVAISHYIRRREGSFLELCSEIADVEIMLKQIKGAVLIGLDKDKVMSFKRKKITRLKKRIEDHAPNK